MARRRPDGTTRDESELSPERLIAKQLAGLLNLPAATALVRGSQVAVVADVARALAALDEAMGRLDAHCQHEELHRFDGDN